MVDRQSEETKQRMEERAKIDEKLMGLKLLFLFGMRERSQTFLQTVTNKDLLSVVYLSMLRKYGKGLDLYKSKWN